MGNILEIPSVAGMFLAAEHESDGISEVMEMVYALAAENPERWYVKNAIPTLDEVRGKIVLSSRYDDPCGVGDDSCGLSFQWETQSMTTFSGEYQYGYALNDTESFWVQNHWEVPLSDLWTAFEATLDDCHADADTFSINLLSSARRHFWLPTPKENARYLNKLYMQKELDHKNYGVVLMDFGTREMAEHLYETNFE